MTAPAQSSKALGHARGLLLPAAAVLLFLGAAITSMTRKAATYDEPVYIVAGLSKLTLGDDTMKEDAPPLVPLLAGLSPWWHDLVVPGGRLPFADPVGREYPFATHLLYRTRADASRILFWSRMAILVPFGLILLVTVWLWSKALFGPSGAAVALALTAFSPNLIAHGRLVAADFPAAATMLLASFLLWRHLDRGGTTTATPHRPAPATGMATGMIAGLGLGLALVTKYTSLLMVPCTVVILLLAGWRRRPHPSGTLRWLAREAMLIFLPAIAVVCLVCSLTSGPGQYIEGISKIYRNIHRDYPWYLFGSFHPGGVPFYYEAVLAVKCSLPLLLLGLGSLAFLRRRHTGLISEACLLLPSLALLVAATQDDISAGIRRVLPVLPVLAISAARLACPPSSRATAGGWRRRVTAGLLVLLLAAQAVTSSVNWPHYLSYFNEAAGGWSKGPELLDDANIDWGQDLPYLDETLIRNGIADFRLCYFGTADPAAHGIHAKSVPLAALRRPRPGIYAVSVHYLIRMRLQGASWLDTREPFDRAGRTLWLYRVR